MRGTLTPALCEAHSGIEVRVALDGAQRTRGTSGRHLTLSAFAGKAAACSSLTAWQVCVP